MPVSGKRMRGVLLGFSGACGALAFLFSTAHAQSVRDVTISRQVGEEEELRVRVQYGAGRLKIRPAGRGLLYRMILRYDEEIFEPVADLDGDRLTLGIEGVEVDSWKEAKERRANGWDFENRMDLYLARDLPMDLKLGFGAGHADLDLGGVAITELELAMGASETLVDLSRPNPVVMSKAMIKAGAVDLTAKNLGNLNAKEISVEAGLGDVTLNFAGKWARDADVKLSMGVGALRIEFPEGLGVRIEKKSVLSSFDPQGLVKRGDYYYSLDWEKAKRRVTVRIGGALGSIKVAWVD